MILCSTSSYILYSKKFGGKFGEFALFENLAKVVVN